MTHTRTLRRPSPLSLNAATGLAVGLGAAALVPVLSGPLAIYLLLGVLGAIGATLVITYPCAGVAAILGVWMSDFSPALFGQRFLTIPYLVTGVLMVPLGTILVRDRTIRFLEVPQARLLLAIGAVHLAATWWSEFTSPVTVLSGEDNTARNLVLFAARFLFLAFVFYFVTTRQRINTLLWLIVGAIVVAALLSWAPMLLGGSVRRAEAWLLDENANRLALLTLFATAMIWSARTHASNARGKLLGLPLLFILPTTALASGSRGGLLQAVALCVLILRESRGWSITRHLKTFVFLACGILFVASVVPTSLLERTVRFDTSLAAEGGLSLQSRIAQHQAAFYLYVEHPLTGIGIGNFKPRAGELLGIDRTLHNSYLLALIEGGPVLLTLYLAMFLFTWRELRRLEKEGPPDLLWLVTGLRLGLAVFLVASATADLWLHELLYVILGMTIAVAALPRPTAPGDVSEEAAR